MGGTLPIINNNSSTNQKLIRRDMPDHSQFPFAGSFPEDCQTMSTLYSLRSKIAMILNKQVYLSVRHTTPRIMCRNPQQEAYTQE